jgi:hypothetical protein
LVRKVKKIGGPTVSMAGNGRAPGPRRHRRRRRNLRSIRSCGHLAMQMLRNTSWTMGCGHVS